jgi:ferrous iron transport protein B
VAIIFPIVGIFFLAFSLLEDSGYLPRLSLLIDRVFKKIGLSGRAVIPMTLGLGCDTMGTLVTRTLETKKERILATLLLALAIPCSAQLGVIFAILSTSAIALFLWALVVFLVMLFIGWMGSRIIPGGKPQFFMELPPLRVPKLSNVLVKTYTRMIWYFKEVLPIFIIASVLLWLGDITGAFSHLVNGLVPLMGALGLPGAAAPIFIYGFFRRDYGAAGLYDIQSSLSIGQLTVAAVTLTLFIPCVAQVMMMYKERGKKVTLAIVAFIFPFAFFIGFLLNLLFSMLGVLV